MSEISDGACWCLRHPRWALLRLVQFLCADAYARDLETLYNLAMGLPDRVAARFASELAYLERKGSADMIPYEATAPRAPATGGVDDGYPYAVHSADAGGGDMRLYWARDVSVEAAVARYDDLVNNEGILGRGVREKSPHSYVSPDFDVEEGSVLVDVGAAEGLFALDNIRRVRHAYLFECDGRWSAPLRKTFAPFADRVSVVKKFVSDRTQGRETLLSDALRDVPPELKLFVKIDAEGADRRIVASSLDFLRRRKTKVACCTYHRQDDADALAQMFEKAGFRTSFSDGWMLLPMNGIRHPYFRRGVIRAVNYD